MKSATVEIITNSEGETSSFRANACFYEGADERVTYLIEGDSGALAFSAAQMSMERQGECTLFALFRAGEQTAFILRANGQEGEIPMLTKEYSLQKKQGERKITLVYDLLYSHRIQTFQLQISVLIPEEK